MNVITAGRMRDWEIILPHTLTFEGHEFKRTSLEMRADSRILYCEYYCPDFFSKERAHLLGLFALMQIGADEPVTAAVVIAKLETLSLSLASHARRERERTEMLELDILTNGADDGA